MELLKSKEVESRLEDLAGWKLVDDGIEKDFEFSDFIEAMSVMIEIAFSAETLAHHPEWSNVYNKVHIRLTTHDAGGLTEKDFKLANKIEEIFAD